MYVDKELLLSDQQAVTVSAASANAVDLGPNRRQLAVGEPLYLLVTVDQAFAAEGAATLSIGVQTDDDAGFGSAVTLHTTQAHPKAELAAGRDPLIVPLPHGVKRYLRLAYTVATGPMTAGKLTACLVADVDGNFF